MNKNVFGVAVVLALLLGGGYALWNPRVPTPPYQEVVEPSGRGVVGNVETSSDSFDVTILYTDTGFSTTSITIKKGMRVRFLNESKEETWPASGIHPTHTLYP